MVISPPASSGFDLTDEPEPRGGSERVHSYRNRTRAGDAIKTGFGDSIGRELGKLVFWGLGFAVVAAGVVLLMFWAKYGR